MTEPYPFPTSADEFTDKRVLVTGGTRGIGAAVVRRFQLADVAIPEGVRGTDTTPINN
jgi:FlaA1/EpsC-like NDP-sugar epimerase